MCMGIFLCVCSLVWCVLFSQTVFWSFASRAVEADAESWSWVLSNPWLQPRSPDCTSPFTVMAALELVASILSYGSDVHWETKRERGGTLEQCSLFKKNTCILDLHNFASHIKLKERWVGVWFTYTGLIRLFINTFALPTFKTHFPAYPLSFLTNVTAQIIRWCPCLEIQEPFDMSELLPVAPRGCNIDYTSQL